MSTKLLFPKDFLWGAATAAYQIEGAHDVDGRGESIWDRFSHTPGKVRNGDTGDVACNHYNLWEEDLALMRTMGLKSYRFSLAWPRILPRGRGTVNQKGLDFYRRLLEALLEADIIPSVTLFHWDLPQVLQDEGGWAVRSTAEALGEYADVVTGELGKIGGANIRWTTLNEPAVAALLGNLWGAHAPGIKDGSTALKASHHMLLGHGFAMQMIRKNCPGAEAGIVQVAQEIVPNGANGVDYDRYRVADGLWHRWFLDPVFGRGYPHDVREEWFRTGGADAKAAEVIKDGDEKIIGAPIDYIGVNYYSRQFAGAGPAGAPFGMGQAKIPESSEQTDFGWEVYPEGLFNVLTRIQFHYRPKAIYITENGCSYGYVPDATGRIRDARRISYYEHHLAQVHRAIQAGVSVKGYYAWSLMDNFEWGEGYAQRFGIVWVDFKTQQRTFKDSAYWYKDVIATNGFKFG